ncbi:MalM family protein [Vibrio breoganii]
MNKNYIALILTALLAGCANTADKQTVAMEPLADSLVCCSTYSEFPYIELQRDEDMTIRIDETAPVGQFSDGRSYFAAFKLSERSKSVSLELSSRMVNGDTFAPKLIALDKNFNVVSQTTIEQFEITPSDAFTRTQFKGNLSLDASKTPYFIIYTSEDQLGKVITVDHPAKVRAKELGEAMPMTTDPKYVQGYFGNLELKITTKTYQAMKRTTEKAPEVKKTPVVESVLPETTQYYHDAIRKAVSEDNLPKALSLLEEAKALNIQDAQQVFVDAVNANK